MKTKLINKGLENLKNIVKQPKKSNCSVLFTSKSSAGAWQIRGEQIAYMRSNWVAKNKPTKYDIENCDILCVVKKVDYKLINEAKKMGKIVIYDIIDSWAQPEDGLKYTTRKMAQDFFAQEWKKINADGYIFPTKNMYMDLGFLVNNATIIYHHYWPQININPLREKISIIGYEGADYLGEWSSLINNVCEKHGIQFVVNPENYVDLDVVILVRGGVHGNFLSRSYKSNVKLANAYASGTPALVHYDEMSAHDTDNGSVLFFSNSPTSFERQLNRLIEDFTLRKKIHQEFLRSSSMYSIENIADQYENYFNFMRL